MIAIGESIAGLCLLPPGMELAATSESHFVAWMDDRALPSGHSGNAVSQWVASQARCMLARRDLVNRELALRNIRSTF